MKYVVIVLVFLFSFVGSASAQETYKTEIGSKNNSSAPLILFTPRTIRTNQLSGMPYTQLEWHAYSYQSRVEDAVYDWNTATQTPPFIRFKATESTLANADVYIAEGTCPSSGSLACLGVNSLSYSYTDYLYSPVQHVILVQHAVWNGYPENVKQATFAHELGHMLGLYHPANGSACQLPYTIMEGSSCIQSSGIDGPTYGDGGRLWRYYEGCEGVSYWCSRLSPYYISWSSGQVTSSWDSRSWNAKYASLKVYTSEDNQNWFYQKTVTHSGNLGFWEDAKDWEGGNMPTGNNYRFTKTISVSGVGSGMYVKVCARPWFTFSTYGYENCTVVQA